MRKKILPPLIAVALIAGVIYWWMHRRVAGVAPVLYGTVELRQTELAFNNAERVREVLVEEGSRVTAGQVLARVDTERLAAQADQAAANERALAEMVRKLQAGARPEERVLAEAQVAALAAVVQKLRAGARPEERAQAEAQAAAAQEILSRLKNGLRPEEIAQAKANLAAAEANERLTTDTLHRLKTLHTENAGAVSQQDLDGAQAAQATAVAQAAIARNGLLLAEAGPRAEEIAEAQARATAAQQAANLVMAGPRAEDIAEAEARLKAAEQTLALVVAGPRAEDIAEAQARLAAAHAQAVYAARQLADAELKAPCAGVVRSRVLEPGELAAPQRPALILAATEVKWIRAYLSEIELSTVPMGSAAQIAVDSVPDKSFDGWVGFISSVAEFTPRAVQTEELRTSLMYEVRIFVNDPADQLRLGMPATVKFTGAMHPMASSPAPVASTPAGSNRP